MESKRIEYDVTQKSIWERLYLNSGVIFFSLMMAAVIVMCCYYIFVLRLSITMAWLILAGYTCYYLFFLSIYLRGRKHMVQRAWLQDGKITAVSPSGERTLDVADVVLNIGYSTMAFACNVLITHDEYLVLNLSSVYAFSNGGESKLKPFYAISKYCRENSPHYENVVKSNRAKRHPWIKIPYQIFEWDCRSKRVERFIDQLFRSAQKKLKEPFQR